MDFVGGFGLLAGIGAFILTVGGKLITAGVILLVGWLVIKGIMGALSKSKYFGKLDSSVRSYALSALKGVLYVILFISIIGVLGVDTASIITVLASAGVAVGLALQGALSNLAGGIMLILFKPFRVGEYVDAAGASGTVRDITMFYTVLITPDNKRITVPNGSLMNANVVNYSSEPLRRVDVGFSCAKTENPQKIQQIIMEAISCTPNVLQDPAPFARISGGDNESLAFSARAWCHNDNYWDVYHDLTQKVTEAFASNGVQAPSARITYNQPQ